MDSSRRKFIKGSLFAGGALLLPSSPARAADREWMPAYGRLEQEGRLAGRIERAFRILEACELCPRQCGVDRQSGDKGYCRTPRQVTVYSA